MATTKRAKAKTMEPPRQAPIPDRSVLPWALNQLIGPREVALAIGVSRRKVDQLLANGDLPKPDKPIGRLPRWRVSTINKWINDEGQISTTDEEE